MTLTDHPTGDNPGSWRRPWPSIAAVIPALDEAQSIAHVVEGLRAQALLASGEIIVVDNGSKDGTGEIARRAGAKVVREERRGYGYACLAGVLAADDAEVIVLLDGDAADDPDDLPRVLEPLLAGEADLVVGSRVAVPGLAGQGVDDLAAGLRQPSRRLLDAISLRGRVSDVGPFRTIRRDDLLALEMREMTYGWPSEMIVKSARAGYRYREVPVSYHRGSGSRRWATRWPGASRSAGASSRRYSATPAGRPARRPQPGRDR